MKPPSRAGALPTLTSRMGRRMILMFVASALLPLATFASLAMVQVTRRLDQNIDESLHRAAKDSGMVLAGRLMALFADLDLARAASAQELAAGPVGERLRERFRAVYLIEGDRIGAVFHGVPAQDPAPFTEQERRHLAGKDQLLRVDLARGRAPSLTLLRRIAARRFLAAEIRNDAFFDPEELRVRGTEVLVYDRACAYLFGSVEEPAGGAALAAGLARNPASGTIAWQISGEPHCGRYWRLFLKPRIGMDLILVQSLPGTVALAPLRGFQWLFAGITGATLLLVAGLGLIQIRRTMSPIAQLQAATERVASGDLGATVPVEAKDELGDLARSFNSMTRQLQENIRRREVVEAQLVGARDQALAAAAAKAEFITNVSHELRTPLTSILAFSELLASNVVGDEDQRAQFLGIIEDQALRLKGIVDNVLDLTAGGRWDLRPVDLGAGLREAIGAIEVTERGRIELMLPSGQPSVLGVPDRLVQLWRHLLDNAIKFSPAGTPIEVRAAESGRHVSVEIRDHGVGIEPADLGRIFEPFRQVGRDIMTDKAPGVGLGLTLARNIVERSGGRIEVESALGAGSTFRVLLPQAIVAPEEAVAAAGSLV